MSWPVQARSLLTAHEDYTTLLFRNDSQIFKPGFVFNHLRQCVTEDQVEAVRRMTLTLDGTSAVFDVPSETVQVSCSFLSRALMIPGSASLLINSP